MHQAVTQGEQIVCKWLGRCEMPILEHHLEYPALSLPQLKQLAKLIDEGIAASQQKLVEDIVTWMDEMSSRLARNLGLEESGCGKRQ